MSDAILANSADIERSIVAKYSWRLAPFLAILYIFCLLVRSNVGIAALQMQPDLKFSNDVLGMAAGIFFIGYFFFEIPANLILEKIGARRWIAIIMLAWGLIASAEMFVTTAEGFYTLRFLLGVAEAGFFPGVVLYITYWVPATARARAMARFLALTAVLGLFSNPLGGLLLGLDGWLGLQGWQWLFLLEGLPSVIMAFVVLKWLPNKPSEAAWLTEEEKRWLAERLEKEGSHEHAVHRLSLATALTEPRMRQLCLVFIISSTAGNAVGFFAPKMIKEASGGLWPDWMVSSLLIFPAIAGAISITLASYHSDRTGRRTHHILGGYLLAALGFTAIVFAPGPGLIIAALTLKDLGERVGAGSYWALTSSLLGAKAAAAGIALINSVGNLGGFIGPKIMGKLVDVTGGYTAGIWMAVVLMAVAAVMGYFLRGQPKFEAE